MESLLNRRASLSLLAALALLLGGALLSACNTAEGFGEDMRSAGEWIEDSVEGE